MWAALAQAVFPTGDKNWTWRRRVALTSALVLHAGILHSIFWDPDLAHATMVMSNCVTGLLALITIYVGGGVADDKFKRDADKKDLKYTEG